MSSQAQQTKMGRIRTKLSMIGRLQLILSASRSKPADNSGDTSSRNSSQPDKQIGESTEINIREEWKVSFEDLLADPEGLDAFTAFLQKEYSEENIKFWQECRAYSTITDIEERKARAHSIYERHLSAGALEPVNIDSTAAKTVREQLDNPSENTFSIAQFQVFNLMKTDSYRRFLRSAKQPVRDRSSSPSTAAATAAATQNGTQSPKSNRVKNSPSFKRSSDEKTQVTKPKSMTLPIKQSMPMTELSSLPPEVIKYMDKVCSSNRRADSRRNVINVINECDAKHSKTEAATHEDNRHQADTNAIEQLVNEIDEVCEKSERLNGDIKINIHHSLKSLNCDSMTQLEVQKPTSSSGSSQNCTISIATDSRQLHVDQEEG